MAEQPAYPGTPAWVKAFGIIALVVVLLLIIFLLTGGPGAHGPGRHSSQSSPAAEPAVVERPGSAEVPRP